MHWQCSLQKLPAVFALFYSVTSSFKLHLEVEHYDAYGLKGTNQIIKSQDTSVHFYAPW